MNPDNSSALDKAIKMRSEDALDAERVSDFISSHLPELELSHKVELLQFPSGASNLTYEVKLDHQSIILRTAPKGANIKGAHDMGREFNVLSKLKEHFPYCPKALAHSADLSILGCEFYMMEKIGGLIPRRELPVEYNQAELRRLCVNLIDVQVKLHQVDIVKTDLISLGKPEGYVSRQVAGWCARYQNALTPDVPKAESLMDWLKDNQPDDSYSTSEQASFIHNDYKLDNVVLDSNEATRIISVLDWEMATVGDPLMDLGSSLAYWVQEDDSDALKQIRMMPTHLKGMMSREELVEYYLEKSGLKVDNFDYYYIFGLFRLAVIAQQIYKRFYEGKTTNKRFASFGSVCSVLINECNERI